MFVGDRKAHLRLSERRRAGNGNPDREHAEKSLQVQDRFLSVFPPRSGRKIALYLAVRGEVGTDRIRDRCLDAGAWLYYPRMWEDGNLTFFRHEEKDGWERGKFGIREPVVVPGRDGVRTGFDLVVVPGLAFDASGWRLGRGHGYYDRFLAGLGGTALTVGLAFSRQLVPEVPVEEWDVPVDAVVTESTVFGRGIK